MQPTGLNSRASWLASMSCTFISFLTMMPTKLSGLLFVEILGRYGTDRAVASYPLFLSVFIRCSGGPLTGYCGERFGLYAVVMVGVILSTLGVGVCFLAEDITTVIIFLGLVYGFGMAFSTTLFAQVLKQHFDKNLTLAISMSMFGSSFGGFITPPLIKWIFQSYGVSGTFLIMSGIMLNGVPAAMLLRYLKPKKTLAQKKLKEGKPLVAEAEKSTAAIPDSKTAEGDKQKNSEEKQEEYCVWELRDGYKMPSDQTDAERLSKVTSLHNGFQSNSVHSKNRLIQDRELKNGKDTHEQTVTLLPKSVPEDTEKSTLSTEANKAVEKPVSKQKAALQSLAIFLDLTFLTMLVTQSAEVIFQILTATTLLDYSRDKGIDRGYEVYFLMALPLAEVAGRVTLSMVIDKKYVTNLTFTIVSFNVLAVVVLIMVWAETFAVMIVAVVVFGLATSGLLSVFPMLVFQYMEPKNYIMALASRTSLYGPMSFLCAPLIGHFRGARGSYDWVYYIQAIMSVLCAVLTVFTPRCAERRNRINEKKREKAKLSSPVNP